MIYLAITATILSIAFYIIGFREGARKGYRAGFNYAAENCFVCNNIEEVAAAIRPTNVPNPSNN